MFMRTTVDRFMNAYNRPSNIKRACQILERQEQDFRAKKNNSQESRGGGYWQPTSKRIKEQEAADSRIAHNSQTEDHYRRLLDSQPELKNGLLRQLEELQKISVQALTLKEDRDIVILEDILRPQSH